MPAQGNAPGTIEMHFVSRPLRKVVNPTTARFTLVAVEEPQPMPTAPVLAGDPVMVADLCLRAALAVWLTWHGVGHGWFIDAVSAALGLTFIANGRP